MPGSRHVIYQNFLKIMGCGHSKTNIQTKKGRNKNNVRKEEIPQKDPDEDDSVDGDVEEVHDKTDEMKTITAIKNEIPLTVAQKKLSCSQQNFFKMLDEKIESGKDYDDSNSFEIATENARLVSLLKDWETASAGSRSLEGTPKKNTFHTTNDRSNINGSLNTNSNVKVVERRLYTRQSTSPIPQSVIHQSYGVMPMSTRECSVAYVQANNSSPSTYRSQSFSDYSYQAFSPLCTNPLSNGSATVKSNDNQMPRSIKLSKQNSIHSIPYDNNNSRSFDHQQKVIKKPCSNGDLIQQQIQIEQVQYRQAKEMAQYRLMKEQQLVQQQQQQIQQNHIMLRNYQSSIHIPMSVAQSYKESLNKNQIER